MKIAIDARALPNTGIGNYTGKLLYGLPNLFPDDEFIPVKDHIAVSRKTRFSKYSSHFKRLFWEQVSLPHLLKEAKIDILHNPMNLGVPLYRTCKYVVTIHDLIPLAYKKEYLSSLPEKLYYSLAIRIACAMASRIITDSVYSKNEIVKFLGVPADKIEVIYLGCSDEFRILRESSLINEVTNKFAIDGSFILTIGGSEPRKNIRRLIGVYERIVKETDQEIKLVIVGGNWRNTCFDKEGPLSKDIIFTGPISQNELIALYNAATVFVFPSLHEGFGLPILEAMACGTPVITSNTTSIPEVCGDSALQFNPFDEKDMFEAIVKALESSSLRNELIAKGHERVKLFRWENTLKQTMKVYRDVLSV